ncbi:hypothetical protein WHR41_01727 [Cladosporium halotolerans]|uniref:CUE domain-containing protein n=1 Tax=Cladosporium halotolerans TaxID=1052096 RepID=A0AB34L0F4_9PEZI
MSNYNNDDNPWADPARDNLRPPQGTQQHQQQPGLNSNNPFYQQSNSPNPWQLGQDSNYAPPPGPPPQNQPWAQQQQHSNPYATQQDPIPGLPPRNKTSTFNEGDFVPEGERGEQREAMEQYEITNARPQTTDDRNIEQLQQEFPNLDGSLVAAIYMDSKQMGAVREMLGELSGSK